MPLRKGGVQDADVRGGDGAPAGVEEGLNVRGRIESASRVREGHALVNLGAGLDLPDDCELVGLAAVLVKGLGDDEVLGGAVDDVPSRVWGSSPPLASRTTQWR